MNTQNNWCTVEQVKAERGFYSDIYKEQTGIRPRSLSDDQLADYMNGVFKLVDGVIKLKYE